MEDFNFWSTPNQVHEDITSFDNSMFLVNPIRAMKFAEFLIYISEFNWLRKKLMRAVKDSSFWKIADAFKDAYSKNYKELGEDNLPKAINDFLDELEKNKEIDFSRNEVEEVKNALDYTFALSKVWKVKSWVNDKLLKLVS